MPTLREVESTRAPATSFGQSLPWLVAALLVMAGAVLIAIWMDATTAKVDRDTLERGAAAVEANIEEKVRILELAGTGTQSLVGQSITDIDITQIASQIDISVLSSLLAVVQYPMSEDGAGVGSHIDLRLLPSNFPVPRLDIAWDHALQLSRSGEPFLSKPVATSDPDRLDYVVATPVKTDAGLEVIGVVFRIDNMLESAVAAAGAGQYAATVVDTRHGDLVVGVSGQPTGEMVATRAPSGLQGHLNVLVRPGVDFPFTKSSWTSPVVIGVGVVIALLLMLMARMAKARAADLEQRLRLAQDLNESKDRFLATVSHELRTPLTVVLGVASEVGPNWDDLPQDDRLDLLAMMSEQANEASNIVEDLLVAARSDPSQLRLAIENTELRSHIDYALASLPKEDRPRIKRSAHGQRVEADSTRLRQIIRNLLENAVRYGGDRIEIRSWREDATVWLTVSDNGIALRRKDLERIFEPYERSYSSESESPTGVGIGLYVSRMLARLMGGELDCDRPNGQTIFRLRLPAAEAIATEPVRTPVAH